jgi:hypothetical protein
VNYQSINDKEFEEKITLKDSYQIMYEFLRTLHERGEVESGVLLGYIGLLENGSSADPAQLEDYLKTAEKIKGAK